MRLIQKLLRFARRHSGKAGKHRRMGAIGMAVKRMRHRGKY